MSLKEEIAALLARFIDEPLTENLRLVAVREISELLRRWLKDVPLYIEVWGDEDTRTLRALARRRYGRAPVDAEEYEDQTGHKPLIGDVARGTCPLAGKPGHLYCGFCIEHDRPRHSCGCAHMKET